MRKGRIWRKTGEAVRDPGGVAELSFHNPPLMRLGVEVLSLEQLRRRAAETLRVPQRPEFHLLLFIEAGLGTHMVDFQELTLKPGTSIYVHPGRVQQWRMHDGLQGTMVLISAQALLPSMFPSDPDGKLLRLGEWPAARNHDKQMFRDLLDEVAALRSEIERFGGTDLDAALVRHLLVAFLIRLARDRLSAGDLPVLAREAAIHRLFVLELEKAFDQRLSVLDYARRMGYSESTLSRACIAVAGHSAKAAIDRRVALEAKRLLVHTDSSVVTIGRRLGFAEPTNFVKFFRRMEGETPQAFREALRSGR